MLDTLNWPGNMAPQTVTLRLRGAAAVGPQSLTGRSLVMQTDAGYWEIVMAGLPAGGPVNVAAWRAFQASLEGGARPAYVPAWDYDQAPWPLAGGRSANTNADSTFTGGFKFVGGHGFYNPAIRISLNAAAALRDTAITVATTAAGTIRPGMVFSLLGERLHVIREILSPTSWGIWPPLRRDYPTGVRCEFGKPTLKAILSTPTDGELALAYGRYGSVSATFREVI